MARVKQAPDPLLATPSESVLGKKRLRSEKTGEERPKKRVKVNVQQRPATSSLAKLSTAGTSQSVPTAPTSAPQQEQKKLRGRPKKLANVEATSTVQITIAPSTLPPAAPPPAELPKKKGKATGNR
ncbi:hypothetical protein CPB84DRAFT_143724 [Gymnopilus junonius]|uniref:Uncharacterized protein n=1 Tax=Gymnopilus junonius TaxID=109634 RepID=A0A9P5NH98_GYMJU|nr:hypothetical protein CPB84DRAFT_143724 [Gymnopilus junonius]